MWNFQKTSTDNHNWTPGKRGAGYIHARTNTPDSFNLLDYSIRTWNIGSDHTDDIEREIRRRRPIDLIVFKFYITPSGGITDRGEGFQNRTSRSDEAVIDFLHRKDNRLHDGREDIRTSSSEEEEDSGLHFNLATGQPCYCGFGNKEKNLVKEANLKYKDIMRGKVPKQIDQSGAEKFQDYIKSVVDDYPGAKKVIPWIVNQLANGTLGWSTYRGELFITINSSIMNKNKIHMVADLLNATDSPYQNKLKPCENCDGEGEVYDDNLQSNVICPICEGWRTMPSNAKEDLLKLNPIKISDRASRHVEWVEKRERLAEIKARAAEQKTVYTFDNGYYVTIMNPNFEEAEWEGITQGNCFQQSSMPYQQAVEDGRLTVYVLRDKTGQGHALWGYNPDGTVSFMESAGRIYGQDPKWEGYTVHDPEIRAMISEANEALNLDDSYVSYNHRFEEEEEAEEQDPDALTYYCLEPIDTVNEFLEQYSEDVDLHGIAVRELENLGREDYLSEYAEIERGGFNWRGMAMDFFNERRSYEDDEYILNRITGIVTSVFRQVTFNEFYEEFENEADTYREEEQDQVIQSDLFGKEESYPRVVKAEKDVEVMAWDAWKQLHTNPFTGEIQAPIMAKDPDRAPHVLTPDKSNPWAFQFPEQEQIEKWEGVIPASADPYIKGAYPVYEGGGLVTFPSFEERKENKETDIRGNEFVPPPAGRLHEEPSGQLFFAKNAASDLKKFVSSIFPRHSHSLTWVKGGKGRGLMLYDGTLITWPVNKKGEPQHADMYEYLTNTKLPETHSIQDFVEGMPFDIYEDGALSFFSENVPADLIADLSKIDYRLKGHPDYYSRLHKTFSEKVAKHYPGFATHFHPYTGQECNCHYGQSDRGPILGRVASQAVRKVKNQDQKHLRSESGQAILDYLHKLISGHGIDEKGEFGQGEYPGIEGMVPWVVKQLKTGWIKPFFNDDGSVANMGQLDSYYGTPEKVKETLSKRANLLIDVEGMSDLSGMQESYGKNGYKFVTGEIDNPNVKVIYINNYGEGNLDPATIQSIVKSRPDIHVFVSEKDRGIADALREQYQSNPLVDISSSAVAQMRFIQDLIDKYPVNPPTDYSIEIPYTFYNNIPWNRWSDWFNATNAPAREGKDIMKMTPLEVTSSSRDHQEYLRELKEQERFKKMFTDSKDEDVFYHIRDPKYKGWTVKQLKTKEDAKLETEVLGHCIGSDEQNYAYNIDEGNIEAFSLRDEYGIPKLTWHYNPDGTLAHVQGKSNDSDEMFRPLVTEFNAATSRDDDDGGDGSEDQLEAEDEGEVWDEVQLPAVDDVEDYTYQYHEDGEGKWELAQNMAADGDATLSDEVSIYEGDPDWQSIVEDLFENYEPGSNDSDDFFSTIMQGDWSMNQFAKEADQYIDAWEWEARQQVVNTESGQPKLENTGDLSYPTRMIEPEEVEEPAMFDYYRQWRNVHTNPKTGELEEPRWLGMGGNNQQEGYEEKHKEELENPWSFMPQWSELKTKTGEPAVSENGYAGPAYLPVSQDPRRRDVATEDTDQPCERCEGTGSVPASNRYGQPTEDAITCPVCKGTGMEPTPITVGPGGQRVLQDHSGQMYFGKLTAKEKAEAWDKPAHKLSKTQVEYINGEL